MPSHHELPRRLTTRRPVEEDEAVLDKITYPLTVAKATIALVDLKAREGPTDAHPWKTFESGRAWFTVDGDVQFYYRLEDLYLLGFRVGLLGYKFRSEEGFMIAGGTVCELSYGGSYRQMGWSRNEAVTVTIDQVNNALDDLRHCTRTREPKASSMLRVVIAFCEAVRFWDVLQCVYDGKPIPADALDWTRRGTGPGKKLRVEKLT